MAYTAVPLQHEEHLQTLREKWRQNSCDPDTNAFAAARFAWLYQNSGSSRAGTWLAVENEHQQIIGYGSVLRSDRYFRGQVIPAGVPAVFVVDKPHRLAAAALAIQRALLTGGDHRFQALVGKPNDQSRLVVARVGYRPLGDLVEFMRWVGPAADLPQRSRDGEYADEVVTAADARFDGLWHRAKDRYPMVAEQTATFLNWRYSSFQDSYRFYCLVRKTDGQLLGYVVFYGMSDGAVITALFCEEPWGPLLDDLLLGFCAQMRAEGNLWVSMYYFGSPLFKDRIEQIGFFHRKHRRPFMVYLSPAMDPGVRTALLDGNNWFVFGGEMDVMLHNEVWRS
jgi:RimJ/RimL family protein N-acetyltransferase